MAIKEPEFVGRTKVRGNNTISLIVEAQDLIGVKPEDEVGFYYSEDLPDYILLTRVETESVTKKIPGRKKKVKNEE